MKKIIYIITASSLFFTVLLIWFPGLYHLLTLEDYPVEYINFFLFLISGILLINKAHQLSHFTSKVVLLLVAIFTIIIAAQELSWGNKLLQTISSEIILDSKSSNDWRDDIASAQFYNLLMDVTTIILVFITMIADALGKRQIYNFPLPHPDLYKALTITTFYREYDTGYIDYNLALIPGLFIILFIEIRNRYWTRINNSIITLTIIVMLIAVHSLAAFNFPAHHCGAIEVRELLLAICCLGYVIQLRKFL